MYLKNTRTFRPGGRRKLNVGMEDNFRMRRAETMLENIHTLVANSSAAWRYIVALGWRKLLEHSGMPASTEEVLREGFNPNQWTVQAFQCCSLLAQDIGKKYGALDHKEMVSLFSDLFQDGFGRDLFAASRLDEKIINSVKIVLQWDECLESLPDITIKLLGFVWFCVAALEDNQLIPLNPTLSTKLLGLIMQRAEQITGKPISRLIHDLDETRAALKEKGSNFAWVDDVITLPEII